MGHRPVRLDAVSVLVEPVRRSMYQFVRAAGRPVTRDEVADATRASAKLAAFHLDKLVENDWLRARFADRSHPLTGGRPPKLYEPSDRQVEVSVPPRRYDVMGEILLATTKASDEAAVAARRTAHDRGRADGERFRRQRRTRRTGPGRTIEEARQLLNEFGFEPRAGEEGEVLLANCPFHALADAAPETVCQANRALVEGLLAGLEASGVDVVLDRADDRCCVVLRLLTTTAD